MLELLELLLKLLRLLLQLLHGLLALGSLRLGIGLPLLDMLSNRLQLLGHLRDLRIRNRAGAHEYLEFSLLRLNLIGIGDIQLHQAGELREHAQIARIHHDLLIKRNVSALR